MVTNFQMSCAINSEILKDSFLLYKKITEQYRDQKILESIKELIPGDILRQDDNFLAYLLKWFKDDYMRWTPTHIKCDKCSAEENPDINGTQFTMQPKVIRGISWKLRKTEVHTCASCGAVHLFPRYGEVLKIAETRTGRCSEWSILFGAVLNSLSFKARIVHDYLDHCWNEVLINDKWLHVDSTLQIPISLNHPYYYERNWGKSYLYIFAFDADRVEDVTQRYTEQWDYILARRRVLNNGANNQKAEGDISPTDFQKVYSALV